APLTRTSTRRSNLSSVLGHNVMTDEQPQPGPLPGPAAGIERFEYVVQHICRHPTAGVGEHQLRGRADDLERDCQHAAFFHALECVHNEVEYDRLPVL